MNLLRAFVPAAVVMVSITTAAADSSEPPAGAAACSGCHPPSSVVETSVPPLVGRRADDIVAQMRAFRSGQRSATVMDRIAKGFCDMEIDAIAEWYQAQR
jgi:cytochrome subunit of sulfide dehydrogenase